MKLLKSPLLTGVLICLLLLGGISCEQDLTTIGDTVVGGEPFTTGRASYEVFAYNKKVEAVQANKLPLYQLGVFDDPVYGRTKASITTQVRFQASGGPSAANPAFGNYSQITEDNSASDNIAATIEENETLKEVILYIPYLRNSNADRDLDGVANDFDADPDDSNSDSDGDGLTDSDERRLGTNPLNEDTDGDGEKDDVDEDTPANRYPVKRDLDSIYGNRDVPFRLKVERSTYFLRDLDPDANFQESQEYYSSQEFSPAFVSDVLFEGDVTISDEQTLILSEDDPDTEEDESLENPQIVEPGISVTLDPEFFQTNLLDKEGKPELLSITNFNEFFRGIHLSVTPITEDIMLLLDLTDATISMNYEFDRSEDGEVVKEDGTYTLNLITGGGNTAIAGNAVNTFINENFPPELSNNIDTGENAERIYLKGGVGSFAEIRLFDEQNGEDIINEIKSKNWIINEANLVFYVDRETLDNAGQEIEPPRLYLYNAETNQPLYNQDTEFSVAENAFGLYLNYGGFIEKSDGKGVAYSVGITDYINNMIVRDSANATLGLTLTPDIRLTRASNTLLSGAVEKELPVSSNISPLGTVLYGSNVPASDNKRLKLEIFYTETN